jgi:hypothetical protein
MSQKLTPNFIVELFKLLFYKKSLLTICKKHFKYQFIPNELGEYKLIYKSIMQQFELSNSLPSLGIVSQQHSVNIKVQEALQEIKNAEIQDLELMMTQLEKYIVNSEFQILSQKVADKWSKGEQEEAIELNTQESQRIQAISLRDDAGKLVKVFEDFHKNNEENRLEHQSEESKEKSRKVPFFIDPLDDLIHGGMDASETYLWILPSGVGKSTALRYTGLKAAVHGYDVLHIQLEGKEKEVRNKYTQLFTRQDFDKIKEGDLSRETLIKVDKLLDQMKQAERELYIYAFERFEGASMLDIRDVVFEYRKFKGKFPELILIDSLDLLVTGENKKLDTDPSFKKDKMSRVAQLMKNLVVECFPSRILTPTQTSDIPKNILNDPQKVITRSNTEGDKTLIKPFSGVFTGNQTDDEELAKTMRIYIDKLRFYSKQDKIYPICTDYDHGAFYSPTRTLEKFYNKGDL